MLQNKKCPNVMYSPPLNLKACFFMSNILKFNDILFCLQKKIAMSCYLLYSILSQVNGAKLCDDPESDGLS